MKNINIWTLWYKCNYWIWYIYLPQGFKRLF